MCGIAGIVDPSGLDRTAFERNAPAALARLAPRGPDGSGIWADAHAGFVHTRLAVIDLSQDGAQPMARHGAVITFNGEIFNYRAVRRELESLGVRFATHSDTEVLLAGWRHWREGLLSRLVGMFAFGLWDPERRELVLARDRFGEKPLLYRHDGHRVTFASDLIALEAIAGERCPLDREALGWLFTLRFVPEPHSVAAGVHKLPPGHVLRFDARGLDVHPWYRLAAARGPRIATPEDARAQLRAAVDAAVADRLVADVPVGAFLSGGVDSAIVAASMAATGRTVRTFTVGFDGASAYYEERPAAREVARHIGAEHTEIAIPAVRAPEVLDAVFLGLDEPFGDSSAVPTYIVSRETRRHVTVALSGDGADEVFAGYRKHVGELWAERYRILPAWLRRHAIERVAALLPESKDTRAGEASRRLRRFLAQAGGGPAERQAGWMRELSAHELTVLLAPAGISAPPLETHVAALRAAADERDPVNAMLAAEIALGLPGDMLVKTDRMSMANALELRSPFLDQRVVECAAAMPGRFKLAGGRGKRILRDAFRDRLPAAVFRRPKKGFESPVAQWLLGPLNDRLRAAIDPAALERQGLFDPRLPAAWLGDLRERRRDTAWILWTLLAFQEWARIHRRAEALT